MLVKYTDPDGFVTKYVYDVKGQVLKGIDNDGNTFFEDTYDDKPITAMEEGQPFIPTETEIKRPIPLIRSEDFFRLQTKKIILPEMFMMRTVTALRRWMP